MWWSQNLWHVCPLWWTQPCLVLDSSLPSMIVVEFECLSWVMLMATISLGHLCWGRFPRTFRHRRQATAAIKLLREVPGEAATSIGQALLASQCSGTLPMSHRSLTGGAARTGKRKALLPATGLRHVYWRSLTSARWQIKVRELGSGFAKQAMMNGFGVESY